MLYDKHHITVSFERMFSYNNILKFNLSTDSNPKVYKKIKIPNGVLNKVVTFEAFDAKVNFGLCNLHLWRLYGRLVTRFPHLLL